MLRQRQNRIRPSQARREEAEAFMISPEQNLPGGGAVRAIEYSSHARLGGTGRELV